MGSGGVAIAALPTVICLKVPFSDSLGGVKMLSMDFVDVVYFTSQMSLVSSSSAKLWYFFC